VHVALGVARKFLDDMKRKNKVSVHRLIVNFVCTVICSKCLNQFIPNRHL